jgi:tetratricopeptide (TPR) repeat protein
MVGSISLFINKSKEDEEIAALHREATRLKDAGDWDKAIAALQKAQNMMRRSNVANTTESWLRLPLFLQQGGRFDEAMEEFNRLLAETDARIANEFSHQPEFAQYGFTHQVRATIYNKMRVACKRQNLLDETARYKALHDEYMGKDEQFRVAFEKYKKKR